MKEELKACSKNIKTALLAGGVLLLALAGLCIYQGKQLAGYREDEAGYAEYRKTKEADAIKLKQLTEDNEKMLRDMKELSNLEKKLRRALIRDVDNSKLGDFSSTTSVQPSSYTSAGQGSNKALDKASTMATLTAQNKNIKAQIETTKASIANLLLEVEGKGGTLASFPDRWPVDGGVITSSYGGRADPIVGGFEYHQGIDIGLDFGEPIYAAGAGTITQAGLNGGYGIFASIDHGNGYKTQYGHMSAVAVQAGQRVGKGEIIGFVGSTGYSTGAHLHFEVLVDDQRIDPFYLNQHK